MPLTPQITLTFTLEDFSGNPLGSATQPAWLRVALCNFGANLPAIPGTCIIGEVSSWQVDIPYYGVAGSIKLWGNDVIVPGPNITYYAISVLDTQKNCIQTALYQFAGTMTIDLSSATPINPPNPPGIPQLEYLPCTGAVPGTAYTAPGQVVAVAYNGVFLRANQALPILSYTLSGGTGITLNFTTETGDLIDALCIVD
jgi:hypothetical protein